MRLVFVNLFGADLRSLAALRVGLGLSVLVDTVMRARDLVGLYTDAGVLPGRLVEALDGPLVRLSLHYWTGQHPALQGAVFVVTACAALALMAGWHTRLATALCWYLVASLQVRQPLVYMGGDSILRLMLFWGLFLPLGARWSLEAPRHPQRGGPDWFVSGGTAAILLQVGIIYWATGIRKTGEAWWNGDAVFIALHQEAWATSVGIWLRDQAMVTTGLTYATMALELAGPVLAFLPVYTSLGRYAAIVLFWGFHLGLASAMNIGLFPLFSMVAWLPFVPSGCWDRLGSARRPGLAVPARRLERVLSALALVCLLYVVVLVAERARVVRRVLPSAATSVGTALRIQQTWNMFAPEPTRASVRYLVSRHQDGETTDEPATSSFRWTVYLTRAGGGAPRNDALAASLLRFAHRQCAGSDAQPAAPTSRIVVRRLRRTIEPSGYGPLQTRVVADVACDRG